MLSVGTTLLGNAKWFSTVLVPTYTPLQCKELSSEGSLWKTNTTSGNYTTQQSHSSTK